MRSLPRLVRLALTLLAAASAAAVAQDTRTVTEPVFPASCTVLSAGQAIVAGEPTSETTPDTTRIQTALNACTAGQAVELAPNGANNAFLSGPLTLPANVTLLVDGGVTLFGSRNPADYQVTTAGVETCGTVGTAGNGCLALLTSTGSNSAIMGFGIIDGRGQDKLLVNGAPATYSWWDQAGNAQLHSGSQNNPILFSASGANLILYKITFRNSPMFHVKWGGNLTTRTGFTAWGVKVITPFSARNSDGIDPSGANISVLNSSLSDGDDDVAVSASNGAQNITVDHVNTYSGHGISVGSGTKGGLNNMLVQNITQMGTAADSNGIGIRIKAQQSNGGLVQNVTYQNICGANNRVAIYLSPFYSTTAGTSYPSFQNIVYRNIHILTENRVTLQGYRNTGATVINPSTITLDNVIFDTLAQSDFNPTPSDLQVTLGPGPVSPLLAAQTGTNVSYTGSVTTPTEAPYPCSASNFQYLVGELYGSTSSATNLNGATTLIAPTNLTLNAMLQPAMSQVSYTSNASGGSYTGTAAPTAAIQFLDGSTAVGTGTLGGNGTIASLNLTGIRPGTHTYTAIYPGDSTYTNPLTMGTFTVNVIGVTTSTAVTVGGSLVYGAPTSITATVTPASGSNPTGLVTFKDGSTVIGTQTLTGGTATLPVILAGGSHSITAVYAGDSTFVPSTSTAMAAVIAAAPSSTSVTASSTAINPSASTTLTVTVAGVSGASKPSGTVTVYDGTSSVGAGPLGTAGTATIPITLTTLGTHTLTASYSGDTNYALSSGTIAIAVVPPFAISAPTTSISLGPNGVSNTAIVVTPAGGFSGTATLTCTSPVSYVTCNIAPSSVALSGNIATSVDAIITVSRVVSSLSVPVVPATGSRANMAWLALLFPAGMLGLATRRRVLGKGLLLTALLGLISLGASGCSNTYASKPPPTGTQVVTVTATGSGVTSSVQITVTVTN